MTNRLELDQQKSTMLNKQAQAAADLYKMPPEVKMEAILQHDSLDDRNMHILIACFAKSLFEKGMPIEDITKIIEDPNFEKQRTKHFTIFIRMLQLSIFMYEKLDEGLK